VRKSRPNPTDALDASSHPAAMLETARASERRASFCGARPRSRVPGLGALAQARSGHPTCEPAGSRRRSRRGARRRRSRRIRSAGRGSSSTSAPPSRKRFSFSACRPARPTSVCVIEQLNVLGFDGEGAPAIGRTGAPLVLRVAEPELAREPRTPGAGRQRSSAQARRLDQLRSEFQLASRPKQVRMALAVIPQMRFRIHGSLLPPSGRGGGRGSSGRP
jgi:hypothetical protein